jgi:hypothetical protein
MYCHLYPRATEFRKSLCQSALLFREDGPHKPMARPTGRRLLKQQAVLA